MRFNQPILNATFRAVIEGLVLGIAAMVGVMIANDSAEFLSRITVLSGASTFLGVLIVRGGFEGALDQRSAIQRRADEAK